MTWNMSKGLLVFVCGLALLGLAACPGGGGGGGKSDRYGSVAHGSNYVGAIRAGGSRSAARSAAVTACSESGGTNCREVLWFRNACGAVAGSSDNSRAGAGWGTSKAAAETKAIAACHAAGGKTCRVTTATNGSPFSSCFTGGSSPAAGQASVIAPRAEARIMPSPPPSPTPPAPTPPAPTVQDSWGAIATSSDPRRYGIAIGYRSESLARSAALSSCGRTTCSATGRHGSTFKNSCGAVAWNITPGSRIYGWAGGDRTLSEAENAALSSCRGFGGRNCHIATNTNGDAASGCTSNVR